MLRRAFLLRLIQNRNFKGLLPILDSQRSAGSRFYRFSMIFYVEECNSVSKSS